MGLIVALLLLSSTRVPIRDVDLYWHLRSGEEFLSGHPIGQIGSDWSFAPGQLPWISTQWLAEVGLFALHAAGSWPALVCFRVLTLGLVFGILARTTLRPHPTSRAAGPFLLAAIAAWLVSEERPQQVTLMGAAVLGGVLLRGITHRSLPVWWLVLPLTALWANVHGGWVLVPAVLALVAIGMVLDQGRADRASSKAMLLSVAAFGAGAISPAGPANLAAVFRVSSAASQVIEEWAPTQPWSLQGSTTVGMLVLVMVAWARSRGSRARRSEVLAFICLLLLSWTAYRNVAPAMLMAAPLAARSLSSTYPAGPREEPRWSRAVGVGFALGGVIAALALLPGQDLLPRAAYPVDLIQEISDLPGQQRVLNEYATAGLILHFGGESTQVAIDGRTDRFGSEYISQYLTALKGTGEWAGLLDELDPTSALLKSDSALAHILTSERGWLVHAVEGDWVLLTAPEATTGEP